MAVCHCRAMAQQEMAAVNATVPQFPAKELGDYENFGDISNVLICNFIYIYIIYIYNIYI